ncbi:MAG TPA: SurA N-terminal domain-containing protein [Longimicrobiales bacterium]
MMRQMRENTKWIIGFVLLAFVGLMVFQWGMDITGRSTDNAAGGAMGRVNGDAITAEEYNNVYRSLYDQQQQQLGNQRITPAMNREIENAAWEQVITNKLLEQELRRRGIRVTDAEITQAAMYMPPQEFQSNEMFQTNGQFDVQKYQAFMASPQADDQLLFQLEAYYRDIIPRSKLFFQATAGTFVTDGQLWRMYRDANERVSARFVVIDPSQVVPETEVQVTDAQVRAYYDAHKDEFPRAAIATVKYVTLDRTPTAADSSAARAQAQQARTLLAGGASFDSVATQLAIDTTRGAQRSTVTVTRNNQFPPAFEAAAFSLPIGQLSDIIATQYGYHVARVTSRTDSSATVQQVLIPLGMSESSQDALLDRADSLEALTENMKLEEAARRAGLTAQTAQLAPPIAFLPGVGVPDEGLDWAFDEADVGDVSTVFESPSAYYMLELVARTDSGTLTLDEAKLNIRQTLITQEQMRKAQEKMTPAIAGKDISAIAAMYNATPGEAASFTRGDNVPGLGALNPAIGAAFGLPANRVSGVIPGTDRLFVIQKTLHVPADSAAWEAQKAQQRTAVLQALADQKWQRYMQALKADAKIVDNRRELARRAARQQDQQQQTPVIPY